jgi:hypothetical protein
MIDGRPWDVEILARIKLTEEELASLADRLLVGGHYNLTYDSAVAELTVRCWTRRSPAWDEAVYVDTTIRELLPRTRVEYVYLTVKPGLTDEEAEHELEQMLS